MTRDGDDQAKHAFLNARRTEFFQANGTERQTSIMPTGSKKRRVRAQANAARYYELNQQNRKVIKVLEDRRDTLQDEIKRWSERFEANKNYMLVENADLIKKVAKLRVKLANAEATPQDSADLARLEDELQREKERHKLTKSDAFFGARLARIGKGARESTRGPRCTTEYMSAEGVEVVILVPGCIQDPLLKGLVDSIPKDFETMQHDLGLVNKDEIGWRDNIRQEARGNLRGTGTEVLTHPRVP